VLSNELAVPVMYLVAGTSKLTCKGREAAAICRPQGSDAVVAHCWYRRKREATPGAERRRSTVKAEVPVTTTDERVLWVDAPSRKYPIIFRNKPSLHDSELFAPHISGNSVLIVTNETVAPLYLHRLREGLSRCPQVDRVEECILPDGEEYKTMDSLRAIIDVCMQKRLDRKSTLFALGGGVIGDLTGFAASVFLRGIPFIQVPTTLLAVVDSAVGGKTGINHPLGKNMIGSFYQPHAVIVDASTLKTLDPRQISAGIAEIIKYGLICDEEFFNWCERNVSKMVSLNPVAIQYAMERSCQCKAAVVAADERESSGYRAILNLGHTFGHAIEAATGYGTWLHGEAVAAGMVMAAEMSRRLGFIDEQVVRRIEAILTEAALPVRPPPSMNVETFLTYMAMDKKVERGVLRLVLLERLGKAIVTANYERQVLVDTIEYFRRLYQEQPENYERRLAHLRLK
jgi:3-dehydroquinate synthase